MKCRFGACAAAALTAACAVETTTSDPAAGHGATGGRAPSTNTGAGGTRASGGGAPAGAAGTGSSAKPSPRGATADPFTQSACPGAESAPGLTAGFPSCEVVCGAPSHCVPTAFATANSGALPDCPDDGTGIAGKCVPDRMGETAGKFVFASCVFWVDGSSGRCVPRCIAAKQTRNVALLAQDVCGTEEVCAPCVDLTNGNATTHACDDYCAAIDAGLDARVEAGTNVR